MGHFAWTIRYPGRENIQKVTTITELADALRLLHLDGVPIECVEQLEQGMYTNYQGGADEWSLTWTKVDHPTAEAEH